jgi:hypothetical protein
MTALLATPVRRAPPAYLALLARKAPWAISVRWVLQVLLARMGMKDRKAMSARSALPVPLESQAPPARTVTKVPKATSARWVLPALPARWVLPAQLAPPARTATKRPRAMSV